MKVRLIETRRDDGVLSMAVDQAMLRWVDETGVPSLRFYTWAEPTLSLGYFQPSALRSQHLPSLPLPWIRRASGGGAIVHDQELTYAIALPSARGAMGARKDLYDLMHRTAISCLARLGIKASRYAETAARTSAKDRFLCFQRRTDDDLVVSGYKVLGSAQRRGKRSVLQHGSLLLAASPHAPELPGASDLSGRLVDSESLTGGWLDALKRDGNWAFQDERLSDRELTWADEIADERFGRQEWNERR